MDDTHFSELVESVKEGARLLKERIVWQNITVKLGDLKPWGANPRTSTKKQAEKLLESWNEFGQVETIAVSPSFQVLDGHQRLSALLTIHGRDYQIDARQSSRELSEDERKKLVVFLHSGAVGSWDWDSLANWSAPELIEWGMDADALKDWKRDVSALDNLLQSEKEEPPEDAGAQIDKAEELRVKWGVESGQLWKLGEHRLICGDCTDKAVVDRVMQGEKAEAVVTDPPYGIGDLMHGGTWAVKADVEFSKMREWDKETSQTFFDLIVSFDVPSIVWGGNYFITNPSRCWLVWDKPEFPTMSSAELAWTNLDHNTKRFECARTYQAEGEKNHPTQKPIELIAWCLSFVENAQTILDPFLGSGTTLIACERLNRKCRAVEISPAYVAVAIQRWVDMTGGEPELIA